MDDIDHRMRERKGKTARERERESAFHSESTCHSDSFRTQTGLRRRKQLVTCVESMWTSEPRPVGASCDSAVVVPRSSEPEACARALAGLLEPWWDWMTGKPWNILESREEACFVLESFS